jgi:hypothetical protein
VNVASLGTYLGNAWTDYLGLRYAASNRLELEPHLPAAWGATDARLRLGEGHVRARLTQTGSALALGIVPEGRLPDAAELRVRAFGREVAVPLVSVVNDTLSVARDSIAVEVTPEGQTIDGESVEAIATYDLPAPGFWDDFAFVEPATREEYEVMRRVERRSELTMAQVKRPLPVARAILSQTDPEGDDWGTTTSFTYPTGLQDGVLDARYLELTADDSTTYFRIDLATPMPEDRVPAAMIALALNRGDGGAQRIERGADLRLPGTGYEHIIFVGDGIRVETGNGRVLGRLEGDGALIEPGATRLTFALPNYILPRPQRGDEVTLLVGAFVPGDGVGRFAPVSRTATDEQGGGKPSGDAANVYDVITATVTR